MLLTGLTKTVAASANVSRGIEHILVEIGTSAEEEAIAHAIRKAGHQRWSKPKKM
ncbi:hypothetical protein [Roseibium sp. M-1]